MRSLTKLGNKLKHHLLFAWMQITTIYINNYIQFIDPSQNDYADTLASVYSVRPHKIPTISTPLDWKEVKHGLDPTTFTMEKVLERVHKKGDLFKDVLNTTIASKNATRINKL